MVTGSPACMPQATLALVELAAQARIVHVIVLHLGLIPASRSRQIAQLTSFIENLYCRFWKSQAFAFNQSRKSVAMSSLNDSIKHVNIRTP